MPTIPIRVVEHQKCDQSPTSASRRKRYLDRRQSQNNKKHWFGEIIATHGFEGGCSTPNSYRFSTENATCSRIVAVKINFEKSKPIPKQQPKINVRSGDIWLIHHCRDQCTNRRYQPINIDTTFGQRNNSQNCPQPIVTIDFSACNITNWLIHQSGASRSSSGEKHPIRCT